MTFRKKILVVSTILLVTLAGGLLLIARGNQPYNVVLISIDTVRPDCLQLYNPKNGAATPNIKRIAAEGYVFTNMISQVPYTLPAHSTMLTGTYPMKHLVQENVKGKLPDSAITLAEVLKKEGYTTAGFVGSIVLARSVGLNQGFDYFDDSFLMSDVKRPGLAGVTKTAEDVSGAFRKWFDANRPKKFFAFLHFYDAHDPYRPPAGFRPKSSEAIELYKGELRYIDFMIGRVYDTLASQKALKNTIVIITGDHGEMFGEHGERGHGYFLYEQALKVPLIFRLSKAVPQTSIPAIVQTVDLMPTVLELLNIAIPGQVQGQSFLAVLQGKTLPPRFAVSESITASQHFGTAPLRSIQDASYKYIEAPQPELYNIRMDPFEEENLYSEKTALAGKMKEKLEQMQAKYSADVSELTEERDLTYEDTERFASLGYISTGEAGVEVDLSRDPKDYIDEWNDFTKLTAMLRGKKFSESLEVIQHLKAANAFPPFAKVAEARAYVGLKDFPRAMSLLDEILKNDPGNPEALNTMAATYERQGEWGKALSIYKTLAERQDSLSSLYQYAKRSISMGKQSELLSFLDQMRKAGKLSDRHNELLGEVYVDLKDFDKAIPCLRKAIARNPEAHRAHTLLSVALEMKGDVAGAVSVLENAGRTFTEPELLLQLGILYRKSGQEEKEFETFKNMVLFNPKDSRGYFYLAKFMKDHDMDLQKMVQLTQKGLELDPSPRYRLFGTCLLADAHKALGNQQEAAAYQEQADQLQRAQTASAQLR